MDTSSVSSTTKTLPYAMNSAIKFDQENAGIEKNEERIPYRLCYKDRIKVINIRPTNEDKIIDTTRDQLHEPDFPETREVLRMATVNSVDAIQTRAIHEQYENTKNRSVTSMERRATPGLYLPYLLGNKDNITPVFNMATYKGFRTQEERKCWAFTKTLERDQKELFGGKEKRLTSTTAVMDISKPVQLHSRYAILHPKSAM